MQIENAMNGFLKDFLTGFFKGALVGAAGFCVAGLVIMRSDFKKLETRVGNLDGKLDSCMTIVAEPDTTINNMCDLNGNRIDSLRNRLNALSYKVRVLEREIDDINESLDAVFD